MFCLYRVLCQKLSSTETIDGSTICDFCDDNIGPGEDQCGQCNVSLEEIMSYRAVVVARTNDEILKKDIVSDDGMKEVFKVKEEESIVYGNSCVDIDRVEYQEKKMVDVSCQAAQIIVDQATNTTLSDVIGVDNVKKSYIITFTRCTFCDKLLKRGDVDCSMCNCSVEEMVTIAVNNDTNVYDSVHDKVIPEADNEVVMDNRGNLGNIRDQGNNITARHVIGIDENKKSTMWRCGQCGCFNAYICANCTTCETLMEEGIWSCGQCTLDNSCADNACTACGAMNIRVTMIDNIATGGVEMKGQCIDNRPCDKCGSLMGDNGKCGKCIDEVTFRKDQWTCGTCGKMHSYCEDICNSCGATKMIGGKWRCDKCTFVNDCKNIKCDVCDEKNDFILSIYCSKCKVVAVTTNKQMCEDCEKYSNPKYQPKQWHCPFPQCNEDNSDGDPYCRTCRLQRGYSRARGDNVKMLSDNKECIVWICSKCHVINKQHELVCHSCQETRFKKKFCKTCKKYNDGTTNNCDKCYQRL